MATKGPYQMTDVEFVMEPRAGVGEAIEDYAEGRISYDQLNQQIAAMGYKTTSTYEMVRHITPKKHT